MALTSTGFTNYTGWSHHTNDQSPSQICTYKNEDKGAYLTSIVAKLGTGKSGSKFTNSSGVNKTGDGKAITATLIIYQGSTTVATSAQISITKTVSSSQQTNGNWYGNVTTECAEYTFTFATPVELKKNTSYTFKISWSGGAILCFSKNEAVKGNLNYDEGVVYIYSGSAWKKAVPYIYNGSAWKKCVPYIYNGSAWKKCGS